MATGQLTCVLDHLRRTALLRDSDRMSDAELLDAFIATHDEAAFEGLVRRHEAMVYGVCRRVLGNTHDAEDAFQAAFLVLAMKASTLQPRAPLGNWLYGVAYRTALKAKSMIIKRQTREKQVPQMPECIAPTEAAWSDLEPLIDQELNRLADKYRVPVVLCDLEGISQRAAARQLGIAEGTLMTRLTRARQLLAKRLSRYGAAFSVAALATLLAENASASAPITLIASTVKAAALVAAGQTAATLISAEVASLTEGVLHTMFIAKIKSAAIVLFVVTVLGSGAGLLTHWSQADHSWAAERVTVAQRPADDSDFTGFEQERGGRDANAATFRGKIVAVAKDGKSLTIETPTPPANRGEEGGVKKHDIKINDKTELKFFGVGLDGAKLAEGLLAQVWTTEGAKDVAVKIQVGNSKVGRQRPDFSGKLTALSQDGATLTFETTGRGGDVKPTEFKVTARTMLTYSNIAKGGAKPTAGYNADVWLAGGSKTDAAAVSFRASGVVERSRTGPAGVSGTLVAIAKDGKVVTLETPPQERGGAASRIDVKIDDKTRITFDNVVAGGDQLTEGYAAQVSLAEGSKDTAASIALTSRFKQGVKGLHGRVVGVGSDGGSFTIEVASAERGQAAEKRTIKIDQNTRVVFDGVGPGGARLTEGHGATIRLNDGSKDAAAQVIFAPHVEAVRR